MPHPSPRLTQATPRLPLIQVNTLPPIIIVPPLFSPLVRRSISSSSWTHSPSRFWVEKAKPPEDYIYENLAYGKASHVIRKTVTRLVILGGESVNDWVCVGRQHDQPFLIDSPPIDLSCCTSLILSKPFSFFFSLVLLLTAAIITALSGLSNSTSAIIAWQSSSILKDVASAFAVMLKSFKDSGAAGGQASNGNLTNICAQQLELTCTSLYALQASAGL